jgi:transketolase
MPRKPEPPKPTSWNIYKVAAKAILLGTVEAPDKTVRDHFAAAVGTQGPQARGRWTELFTAYRSAYPQLATEIDLIERRELPAGWDAALPIFPADSKGIAGRDASGKVLNALAQNIPWLLVRRNPARARLVKLVGANEVEPLKPLQLRRTLLT